MANRSLQFFGTRQETFALVSDVAKKLDLHVFFYSDFESLTSIDADRLHELASDTSLRRIYLSKEHTTLVTNQFALARLGMIMVDLPEEREGTITLASISAKSDWYEEETQVVRQVPEVLKIFKRIAEEMKSRITFPVWARNKNGGKAVAYKNLGYLPGAKMLVEAGGTLTQAGVPNVVFGLERLQE